MTNSGLAFVLQDFAAGEHLQNLGDEEGAGLLDLVAQHRSLLPPAAYDWTAYVRDLVFNDPLRQMERLRSSGETAAALAQELKRLTRPFVNAEIPSGELVHGDLNISNVLWSGGVITAVIDIESVGRGCAAYDLLTPVQQAFMWAEAPESAVVDRFLEFALSNYGWPVVAIMAAAKVIDVLCWALDQGDGQIDAPAGGALTMLQAMASA